MSKSKNYFKSVLKIKDDESKANNYFNSIVPINLVDSSLNLGNERNSSLKIPRRNNSIDR